VVNKIFWLLFSFSFTFCFAIAYVRLFYRFRESDGFLRIQLKYVLAASFIPTSIAWFFNISFFFFEKFEYDWLGAFLTLIFSFTLFYFVFYYRK